MTASNLTPPVPHTIAPSRDPEHYAAMYAEAAVNVDRLIGMVRIASQIMDGRSRYERVAVLTGVPWWFTACLHQRECSGSFARHLHNGDPLTARTVNVPKGRPVHWLPPFGWEDSAVDALQFDGFANGDWSVGNALRRAEQFNGEGYNSRGLPSPYLWGGTTLQKPGKYTADGHFDPATIDKQPGIAAIMKVLEGLDVSFS